MDKAGEDITRAHLWALELFQRIFLRQKKRLEELPDEESSLRLREEEVNERLLALEDDLKVKQLEQKRLEIEVDGVKDRRKRHQRQLLSAKDNREYQTLLEEIEHENRRQSELEDRILELMESLEVLVPGIKRARAEREEEVAAIEGALKALSIEEEKLEDNLSALEKSRTALVDQLDIAGRRIFAKLAGQRHICALVDDGVCSSCSMEAPTQAISAVRAGTLCSCESCSAVLFTKDQAALARTMSRNRGYFPEGVVEIDGAD